MSPDTVNFVSKLFAGVLALVVVGIAGALIAAIFHFGDGEAQAIIGDLTPPFLGILGSLSLAYIGHQVAAARALTTIAATQTYSQAAPPAVQPVAQPAPAAPAVEQSPAPVSYPAPAPSGAAQGHITLQGG